MPIITVDVRQIGAAPPIYPIYALSGGIFGTNVTIVISRGDVLRFELNNLETSPFWIKTVQETGEQNGVPSGISGVPQGSISGRLIWDTNDIIEETYYYVSEHQSGMGGRIHVLPEFKGTTMPKFIF